MAIKIIKFDLPINGIKVKNLEELRDNLTDEIVTLARSGQLERWFKSRQLHELAHAVADAVARQAEDKALFLALCAVLEVEVHPDDASAIFDVPPEAGRHVKGGKYFELYEELKESHEAMQEKAKNRITELESAIRKIFICPRLGKVDLSDESYFARIFRSVHPQGIELHENLRNTFKKTVEL